MDNATSFGKQAQVYAAARPGYPEDLFDWIAKHSCETKLIWDVGTGSGQAALSLAQRFDRVHATDIDPAQLQHAAKHPHINYHAAPAHASGLPDNSVDAITVATALHWFDFKAFWPEVARVAKPNTLFCAWTYHRMDVDGEARDLLLNPVLDIIDPYWAEGNRLSWRGYSKTELDMPFEQIPTPEFSCDLVWTPPQIAALLRSWSAHKRARDDGHDEALAKLEEGALGKLGASPRAMSLPLNMLAARIG